MLSRQFQKLVAAEFIVVAGPLYSRAVIVSHGSILQLWGHVSPTDEHRTITAPDAMLYSRRMHVCGH
jgi:hypothetical protein